MEENNNQELDMNHLMEVRKEKLEKLKEEGRNPFEITKFNKTHTSKEIKDNYEELEGKDVTVAGRIIAKRIMGKASFCHIQDGEGKLQSYVSINDLGEESYKQFTCKRSNFTYKIFKTTSRKIPWSKRYGSKI